MNKKALIIIIAAVVVVGAAAFVFLSGMLGGGGEEEPVDKPVELSYYVPGDYFVTNIVQSELLLKATISLGFDKATVDANVLKERTSEIRDVINRELRTLTEEDVNDPDILDILKERLLISLSGGLGFDNLHDIRYEEFVMQ